MTGTRDLWYQHNLGSNGAFMIEDKIWLRQLKKGKLEAFERIYTKYKDGLLTLGIRLCGDRDLAEDLLHDVMTHFVKQCGRLSIQKNLKSYLSASVVNRFKNHIRSPKNWSEELEEEGSNLSISPDDPNYTYRMKIDRIEAYLLKLPEPQRVVILLHLMQEMSFREISGVLNLSINTVQSRYRYGIAKLTSLLNGGHDDEKK